MRRYSAHGQNYPCEECISALNVRCNVRFLYDICDWAGGWTLEYNLGVQDKKLARALHPRLGRSYAYM